MTRSAKSATIVGAGPDARAAGHLLARAGWAVTRNATPPRRLGDTSLLIVDEWTAETAPHVVAARQRGVRVSVLAELILASTPRTVVGVTGTAGKTTTCRLIAAMLDAAGMDPLINPQGRAANAWPDHAMVEAAAEAGGWLVAELTSTHLCYMDTWRGPDVAVVTNIWPDHVELHGSLDAYVAAKRRIVKRVDRPVVLNADDVIGRTLLGRPPSDDLVEFSTSAPVGRGAWIDGARIRLRWEGVTDDVGPYDEASTWMHPGATACAVAAARACGVETEAIAAGLAAAAELPHRFDRIGEVSGVQVIDDSMAATPTKAMASIARLDAHTLVVIVGGLDTIDERAVHADASESQALHEAFELAARARLVIAFGAAGRRVAGDIGGAQWVETLRQGVDVAADHACAGDTILLAPMFPMPQSERAAFGPDQLAALARRAK